MSFYDTDHFEKLILTPPFEEYLIAEEDKLRRAIFGGRLLEIGCGTGRLVETLAFQASRYIGIDSSPRMCQSCIKFIASKYHWLNPKLNIMLGTAFDLPLPDRYFDWVVMPWNVLGNFGTGQVENKYQAMKEAVRILKQDGKIFLTVLSNESTTEYRKLVAANNLHIAEDRLNRIILKEGLVSERFSKSTLALFLEQHELECEIEEIGEIALWAKAWKKS